MITDSSSRSVTAEMQVTVTLQPTALCPGHRQGRASCPGPAGGVVPGRRHDAVGRMSLARHPALSVEDPGGCRCCDPGRVRRDCGPRGRAASVRARRRDIPGWGAAAGAVTSPAPGSARGRPGGRAVPGHLGGCRRRDRGARRDAVFRRRYDARAWNGSWNGAPDTPSTASAISAITRGIGAASAFGARGRTYGKEKVYSRFRNGRP